MHQCNSPACVKWKLAPCKKLQRENSAHGKQPVTKAEFEGLVEQLSLNWECCGVMEFVESLQLFKCEGDSEIQLIAGLPILQRAQRGCLLKSTFPSPSTVTPEAMEIKSRDSEALDQPWTQSGTVQILAKGSQGCFESLFHGGAQTDPRDHGQDSSPPAALI